MVSHHPKTSGVYFSFSSVSAVGIAEILENAFLDHILYPFVIAKWKQTDEAVGWSPPIQFFRVIHAFIEIIVGFPLKDDFLLEQEGEMADYFFRRH